MTITSQTSKWSYNGDGATLAFPFTNKIFAATDLNVYVGGVLKTLTTDYAVSGINVAAGGSVTFVTAPPVGTGNVVISRNVPPLQGLAYQPGDTFPSASHEKGLDLVTVLVQQVITQLAGVLKTSDSDVSVLSALPSAAARANGFLAFDATGLNPVMAVGTSGGVPVSALGAALIAGNPFSVQNKTGNYNFVSADRACVTRFTGASASTFTLLAPATAGNGWPAFLRNDGTARLTVAPASGLIDGVASIVMERGESHWVVSDGSNWFTIGRQKGLVPILRLVASAQLNLDFTEGIDATDDDFVLRFQNMLPTGSADALWLRISEAGSFKTTGSYFHSRRTSSSAATGGDGGATSDAKIIIAGSISNSAGLGVSGDVVLPSPGVATNTKMIRGTLTFADGTNEQSGYFGGFWAADTGAIDGLRLTFGSGSNIASGIAELWRFRR